jgi:hypothetical protein
MKAKLLGLIVAAFIFGPSAARATTYTYDLSPITLSVPGTVVGPTTVTGTIETNCDNNCVLNSSNIIAWSFTGIIGSTPAHTISSAGSDAVINEIGDLVLIAKSTGIVFSLTASSTSLLEFCGGTTVAGSCTSQDLFTLFDNTSNKNGTGNIGWQFSSSSTFSAPLDPGDQITLAAPMEAATPLPAALPLFATGLGALGLFGWRRKRKINAAIASDFLTYRLIGVAAIALLIGATPAAFAQPISGKTKVAACLPDGSSCSKDGDCCSANCGHIHGKCGR